MTDIIRRLEKVLGNQRQQIGSQNPLQMIAAAAQREYKPLSAPLSVQVEIIDYCRQHCVFCLQGTRNNTVSAKGPVSLVRLSQLAGDLAELGVAEVVLSGGEPGCHPELPQVVSAFKKQKFKVIIETSGADMPTSFLWALRDLLDPTHDLVRVSMDAATAQTYLAVRGVDAFDRLQKVMDFLQSWGIRFMTTTVMLRENRSEFLQIAKSAYEAGAVACEFGPPFVGEGSTLPGELELEKFLECCETLQALPIEIPVHLHMLHALMKAGMKTSPHTGQSGFCCAAGFISCAVNVKGLVGFCPYMNDTGTAIGMWRPGTFASLWKRVAEARVCAEELADNKTRLSWEEICPAARR